MMWLAGFFALAIGGVLGLLGGGGSILAVPVLVHVAGLPGKEAIAMSLLIVGFTSLAGALGHAHAGNVDWRVGLTFAPFAMFGAFLGGSLARFVPGEVLLGVFAVMMVFTALAMLRKRTADECDAAPTSRQGLGLVAVEGLAIGAFTGFVGAGGGFLIVPVLMLLGGLTMRKAVGTSLLVITLNSLSGFVGYISHVHIDYVFAGAMVALSIAGALIGTTLSHRVPAAKLRVGFAYAVLVMGVGMLAEPIFAAISGF